jgi:plastocyanin
VTAALASAVGGVLVVPAGLLAAGDGPAMEPSAAAAPPPAAVLDVRSDRPAAGVPVELDASGSRGLLLTYRWDLDGDGSFEADGGSSATTAAPFEAGSHRVGVQVVDQAGRSDSAHADLSVAGGEAARPPEPPAEQPVEQPAPDPPAPGRPAAQAESAEAPDSRLRARGRSDSPRRRPVASAAASSSVAIENFLYSPATVSVNVGDTVTWTNRDEDPHTATASGGGFETGTLDQGQSGSHTFSEAGRFPYICALHPSMKGTVVVAAGSGGGSPDSGGASGAGSGAPGSPDAGTGAAGSAGSLPTTGQDLLALALVGALLLTAGSFLRWMLDRRLAQG